MPKLNDTHLMLLAHAAKQDASLYPLPVSLMKDGAVIARAATAIEQLTGRGLIEERETSVSSQISRTDGDIRYGQFITEISLAAIGIDDMANTGEAAGGDQEWLGADAARSTPTDPIPRQTKTAMVLALLSREDGASMEELIAATGWLPHTTRAALTGLRKKGHLIEKSKRGDVTYYRVVAA